MSVGRAWRGGKEPTSRSRRTGGARGASSVEAATGLAIGGERDAAWPATSDGASMTEALRFAEGSVMEPAAVGPEGDATRWD